MSSRKSSSFISKLQRNARNFFGYDIGGTRFQDSKLNLGFHKDPQNMIKETWSDGNTHLVAL